MFFWIVVNSLAKKSSDIHCISVSENMEQYKKDDKTCNLNRDQSISFGARYLTGASVSINLNENNIAMSLCSLPIHSLCFGFLNFLTEQPQNGY